MFQFRFNVPSYVVLRYDKKKDAGLRLGPVPIKGFIRQDLIGSTVTEATCEI